MPARPLVRSLQLRSSTLAASKIGWVIQEIGLGACYSITVYWGAPWNGNGNYE